MEVPARSPSGDAPTLAALRAATADRHRAIETHLRLGGEFGRGHYVAVLQGFDRFLQAWEPQLEAALPPRLRAWFAPRRRGAAVRQDLHALDAARGSPAALDLGLHDTATAFGSLYVMEGSALGAQVIAPRVAAQLGLHAHNGAAYFDAPAAPGPAWREFRALLEHEVADGPARERACRAAAATFEQLHAAFELPAHEPAAA